MSDRPPRFDVPDGELLERYLAGDCTEAETASVRRYLMTRPGAAQALDGFVRGLDGADLRPPAPDDAASWAALRRRLREGEDASSGGESSSAASQRGGGPAAHGDSGRRRAIIALPGAGRAPSWRRRALAACAVAAAALATVGYQRVVVQPAAPAPPPRIYTTAVRQRAELRLSDGTRVRLAPASRLRIATDYGTERRDVYLEGEAYFDVEHDARRPFTVYVGNASARDLGTSFGARGYADEGAVQVVVREGEVAMSGVGRLAAGDLGRLASEGKATVRRRVDVDALLGWVDGRLDFQDAPLAVVLRDVRRWKGTDVRLADSTLGALPFTGTLTGLRSAVAIDVIGATLGLRAVRRADGGVVLERIPGRTPRPGARRRSVVDAATAAAASSSST